MAIILPHTEAARTGTDSALICQVPSGWVFLCSLQFLRGYCILQSDPVVPSINTLDRYQRSQFLGDMVLVGDAILEVTGAYRINYFIAGNSDPVLHAHIIPRFMSEPEELRNGLPWSHPNAFDDATKFDEARDKDLMHQLAAAIQKRL